MKKIIVHLLIALSILPASNFAGVSKQLKKSSNDCSKGAICKMDGATRVCISKK